jgi:hypothetical protein
MFSSTRFSPFTVFNKKTFFFHRNQVNCLSSTQVKLNGVKTEEKKMGATRQKGGSYQPSPPPRLLPWFAHYHTGSIFRAP